jgi:hypothetical protein
VTLVVDNNLWSKTQASQRLGAMGRDATPTVPVLLSCLRSDPALRLHEPVIADPSLCLAIIQAITRIAPGEKEVLDELARIVRLRDDRPFVRQLDRVHQEVARCLAEIGKEESEQAPEAVRVLIGLFRSRITTEGRDLVALATIRALGTLGPAAAEAAPELRKHKLHPDGAIRAAVSTALEQIGQ